MKRRNLRNEGFSLVELIIVIAVMAILAGVLAPALIKYIRKSKEAVYIETAEEIQKAVVNMVVLAEEDGYEIRAVTYNGSNDDTVGSGTLLCKDGAAFSDMSDASAKQKYFSDMCNTLSMGKLILGTGNGTPLQIALSESGSVVASDSETGVQSVIILSDRKGKLKAKLSYSQTDGKWIITESY